MEAEVESAMQTPDGAWRVEVVKRCRSRWFRVVNETRDVELDWLSITAVERILGEADVDMATLAPISDEPPARPEPRREAA